MKILRLIIPLIILAAQPLLAQKGTGPTPEDVAMAKELRKAHDKDDIAILEDNENISFGLSNDGLVTVSTETSEKLMNINHRADINKYEFYDSQSEIENFSLRYSNNKKTGFEVKDEMYSTDDMFYNDYRVKYMEVSFPVQGYTYSYELSKKYNDVKYFTSLYFNDEYPIVNKKYEIRVPDWLELEIKEFNFGKYNIKKTKTQDAKEHETVYTYTVSNIEGFAKEDDAPGHSYTYPHLLLLAKSYTKDGQKTTLFNSADDLYKWYKKLVSEVDEHPEAMKEKVAELTAGAKNDTEKIKNIYYWVQDNIRYIAFEDGLAGYKPDASQNVFKKRYGDCKGMANLLRQMLTLAGFDARLTWIGTRSIAYDYTIPSLGVDNHMICTLFKDGKKYYLDGTEKYNSFGEYAERIQGREVMIANGDKYILDKVPAAPASANLEVYNTTFTIDGETLKGKVSGVLKGESRASFLYGYNSIMNDKKEKALEYYITRDDKNYSVDNIKTSDLKNRDIDLTLNYDITLNNKVSSFDNELYINLNYDEEFSRFDFKDRKTDYEFSFKRDYESGFTLQIPEGYKVERLPESLSVDNDSYTIQVSFEQKGNTIVYKKHFVIKKGSIKKEEFPAWDTAITKLKSIYNDQITLTKL